jgi:hypothetical protein
VDEQRLGFPLADETTTNKNYESCLKLQGKKKSWNQKLIANKNKNNNYTQIESGS